MDTTLPGRLEVITGPMFSGKSEELIRRLKRARIARQRVACYKPDIDLRYHRTAIASHSAQTHEACTVTSVARLRDDLLLQLDEVGVIGVDEAQFFDGTLQDLAMELVHAGKRVLIAGLDTTYAAEPFGPIPNLMAIADEVTKLSAVCMVCGAPAIHTQRLGSSQELVVVGATGVYEARCRLHFRPFLSDETEPRQLSLVPSIVIIRRLARRPASEPPANRLRIDLYGRPTRYATGQSVDASGIPSPSSGRRFPRLAPCVGGPRRPALLLVKGSRRLRNRRSLSPLAIHCIRRNIP